MKYLLSHLVESKCQPEYYWGSGSKCHRWLSSRLVAKQVIENSKKKWMNLNAYYVTSIMLVFIYALFDPHCNPVSQRLSFACKRSKNRFREVIWLVSAIVEIQTQIF